MSEPSNARPGAALLSEDGSDALPLGTRLAEFEVRQVLGAGGFGIVYRAWDEALQRDVALKEYMPTSLAGRGAGGSVTLRSRMQEENFSLGLQSFVNEARLLARFDQPALVKVFRFWEGNGTAYMAMPLYKGRNLRQLRKELAPGTLDDAWMRTLIEPLLGALEVMHEAAVYHRDIAPDNIIWCDDNRPVLLDFGAARLVLADRTQNVTAILKPQFAPIEQYAETQTMRQGPWTDLYALAGTCYFMLTGRAPLPATARVMGDELEPLARLAPAGCSPRLLQILDWAMAVRPQDRPQSVAQFREALAGHIAVPVRPWPAVYTGSTAAAAEPASDSSGYEKTIQATMRTPSARPARPAAKPPDSRHRRDDELERPERSVMLPPKAGLPLKPVLLLLILATVAAGAWTTRPQWMPMVGLQAALPVAQGASAPQAPASEAAALATPASAAVAEAASAAASQAVASAPAASEAAAPAPDASAVAPAPVVAAEAAAPPPRPAHAKSAAALRAKALEAKIAALKLPPPVLPPDNEAHVTAREHAALVAPAEAAETTAAPASSAAHGLGPREACAGLETGKMAACVRRLCDSEPRYQRYPICQRVHRQEEQQQ